MMPQDKRANPRPYGVALDSVIAALPKAAKARQQGDSLVVQHPNFTTRLDIVEPPADYKSKSGPIKAVIQVRSALVDRPTYRPAEARPLSVEEARRVIKAARNDRFEALWLLCLTAGLRLGEALALRWADVDLDRRSVDIRRALVEAGGYVSFASPKTLRSRRRIEIGELAREALLRRLAAYDGEAHGSELIFSSLDGTPLRRSNLRRSHFLPLLKSAAVSHVRIHDLRHSMASLGLAAGLPAKVLADRLGHSSTRLTDDRYSHVLLGVDRRAADSIEQLLKG